MSDARPPAGRGAGRAGSALELQCLNWQWPWLAPYAAFASQVREGLARGQAVADVLDALAQAQASVGARAPAVRFVPQNRLPAGQAYEDFIWRQRQVPTRDNLHDLFNGLSWLAFPLTKARLNQLQAAEIAASGVQPSRGALRDALTLFDENAALVLAPPELMAALRARQWSRLFIGLRPLWAQARVLLIGHAAQEKLQRPRKNITAHVYLPQSVLPGGEAGLAALDAALAADLEPAHLAQKPYAPLPILGIPGWWAPNEDISFYDDRRVFRPPREEKARTCALDKCGPGPS